MKPNHLLVLIFIGIYNCFQAQNVQFKQLPPMLPAPQQINNFIQVQSGMTKYGDFNGDNYDDIIIIGKTSSGSGVAKMYLNDGLGNFIDSEVEFTGAYYSSIDVADIDGDLDLDIIIAGSYNFGSYYTKLYLNDGNGNFTEELSAPFVAIYSGTVSFFDMENDGDNDVIITGQSPSGIVTKLYENNGFGVFTEIMGIPFEGVRNSAVSIVDVNGDNYKDIILSGQNGSGLPSTKLFLNSAGVFTESIGNTFANVQSGAIDVADINGDSYPDIVLTGINMSATRVAKLYTNDGTGVYTEIFTSTLEGVEGKFSCAFSDIDGDNDKDLLLTGLDNSTQKTAKIYTNDGSGAFSETVTTNIFPIKDGSAMFIDLDNDGFEDLLTTGSDVGFYSSSLYMNDGTGVFEFAPGTPCHGAYSSGAAFEDVNGDSLPDLLVTGITDAGKSAILYLNNGSGNFHEVTGTPFTPVQEGDVAFADVNGDTFKDVIIVGLTNTVRIAKLYINDGSGNFVEELGTPFPGVENGTVEFGDMDNDGDQDLLITGWTGSSRISKLYNNDGAGVFTEVTTVSLMGVQGGSTIFEDFNGDNYPDIMITGFYNVYNYVAKLYLNDGNGGFTELIGTPFEGVMWSSIDASDVNGDNSLDIILTGENDSGENVARLYLNDGSANFTEVLSVPFEGVAYGTAKFGDVNGDLREDLMITGKNNNGKNVAFFYMNDGSGNFDLIYNTPFEGVNESAIDFADIDGDMDYDVFVCGRGNTGIFSRIYENIPCISGFLEPLVTNLPDTTSFCSLDTLNQPLAITNCGVAVIGTTSINFPITTQGITQVVWSFDDGNGNTTTQIQNIVINDSTFPIPDTMNLTELSDVCSVTPITPTAIDNCVGTIFGVPNISFPITTPGTTVVTWSYDDGNGNISTQTQNIVINDITAPVAEVVMLSDVVSECEVNTLTAPTAIDNCSGIITGTQNTTLPITAQGTTVVTWIYDDGNGNISTQTQNVIITDLTAPVANMAVLSDVTSECEVNTLTAPTAIDNCSGIITGTQNTTLPITAQGTTVVTWIYDDGNGNISTQTQNVIVNDVTPPLPDNSQLADVVHDCNISELFPPTATDNCSGAIIATSDANLPIITPGTTVVTWIFDDNNGNITLQTQNVIININPIDVTTTTYDLFDSIIIGANASGYNYQWIEDCGNNYTPIIGANSQNYTPSINGTYAVIIDNGTCSDTSDCVGIASVGIQENLLMNLPVIYPQPNTGKIHIDMGTVCSSLELTLLNALGEKIKQNRYTNTAQIVYEIEEPAGLYILQFVSENGQLIVAKIIKQ